MQCPDDADGFDLEDQFYLGDTGMLIHPVVDKDADSVEVYLGEDKTYYDYLDYTKYKGRGWHKVPAPLNKVPILVKGGSIIPRKDRIRGSSARMVRDPYTLFITLSDEVPIFLIEESNSRALPKENYM
jgi:mannosyl-oligosaccharide alpha-1,3-glucosidase